VPQPLLELSIWDTIRNLNRRKIFGFVNSAIVDCPLVFLTLIIDLNETSIPLNLIVIVVRVALDRGNNHGVNTDNGGHNADVQSPKSSKLIPKSGLSSSIGRGNSATDPLVPNTGVGDH
jgi:hypothetical protein